MSDKEAAIAELRKHWSFDERQQHTHNWHSRENYIEGPFNKLLYGHEDALAAKDAEIAELKQQLSLEREVIKVLAEQASTAERERDELDGWQDTATDLHAKLKVVEQERDEAVNKHAGEQTKGYLDGVDDSLDAAKAVPMRKVHYGGYAFGATDATNDIINAIEQLKSTPSGAPGDVEPCAQPSECRSTAPHASSMKAGNALDNAKANAIKHGWIEPSDLILRRDVMEAVQALGANDLSGIRPCEAIAAIESVPENPDAIRAYLRQWPDVLLHNEHLQHIRVETERRVREDTVDACVHLVADHGAKQFDGKLYVEVNAVLGKLAKVKRGGDANAGRRRRDDSKGSHDDDTPPGGRVGVRCEGETMGRLLYAGKGKPKPVPLDKVVTKTETR